MGLLMNDTDYVALVDTSRDELRERIEHARERFDRLIRAAEPTFLQEFCRGVA